MAAQIGPFLKLKDFRFGELKLRTRWLGVVDVAAVYDSHKIVADYNSAPPSWIWDLWADPNGLWWGSAFFPTENFGQGEAIDHPDLFTYFKALEVSMVLRIRSAAAIQAALEQIRVPRRQSAEESLRIRLAEEVRFDLGQYASNENLVAMLLACGGSPAAWQGLNDWYLAGPPTVMTIRGATLELNGVTAADRGQQIATPWRLDTSVFAQKRDFVLLCGQVLEVIEGTEPNVVVHWTSRPAVQIDLDMTQAAFESGTGHLQVFGWLDSPLQPQLVDEWFPF